MVFLAKTVYGLVLGVYTISAATLMTDTVRSSEILMPT
jgi:hypothetical protein